MIIFFTSQGGMGERGISSPIAAQVECPDPSFVFCKQSSFPRFSFLPFQSLSRPVWDVGFDSTSKLGD